MCEADNVFACFPWVKSCAFPIKASINNSKARASKAAKVDNVHCASTTHKSM